MKKNEIYELINSMSELDLIGLHNEYCDAIDQPEFKIYHINCFDAVMSGVAPWEIARSIFFSNNFNPTHKFFAFNCSGNLVSFDYLSDEKAKISIDDIVEYIIAHDEDFGIDAIRLILNEE